MENLTHILIQQWTVLTIVYYTVIDLSVTKLPRVHVQNISCLGNKVIDTKYILY